MDLNLVAESYDGTHLTVRFSRTLDPSSREDRRSSFELQQLPQCTYLGSKDVFVFPITAHSVEFLSESYPTMVWNTETGKQAYDLVASLEKGVERRVKVVSKYMDAIKHSTDGKVPATAVPAVIGHEFKRTPMAHQLVGFECARAAPFFGLFMEMGTGKTKVISDLLDYASQRRNRNAPLRALICSPKSVLVNWVRELNMDVGSSYRVAVLSRIGKHMRRELRPLNLVAGKGGEFGTVDGLLELIRCKDVDLQVAIINYDNVKARLELLEKMKFDIIVLDESHKIKAMKAKRTKAVLQLAMSAKRRFILTGTPLTQNPMDLFAQFEFLGPGMALLGYTTFYAYGNAYSTKNRWNKTRSFQNTGKLLQLASKWAFSVKKKDCLDLPDKVYTRREVEMSQEQADIYEQVATEVLLVLESLGAEVTIQNILVQYLRLAQVTSGYIKTTDGREVEINKGHVKINELMDIIEETNGQKVVVWSRFVHEIKAICERLEKDGVKHVAYWGGVGSEQRQRAVDSFQNDPDVKVFVGNAQAGGIGINLTAGSVVVYTSNDFSLANRLQSEDRTHRIGQKNPVTYIDIICEDTIDELVLKRLQSKREMAEFFTNPTEMVSSLKEFLANTVGTKEKSNV